MKSVRLTNDLKYKIKKAVLRQINKEFSQVLEEFSTKVSELYKERLPKEIIEFDNKYNNLINWSSCFLLKQFESLILEDRALKDKVFERDYTSLTRFKFVDSVYSPESLIREEKDLLVPYYDKLKQLKLKREKIDKDLSYLLSNINTSLQLQKALPSVYKVLQDILGSEEVEIEKLEKSIKEMGKEVEQQLNLFK